MQRQAILCVPKITLHPSHCTFTIRTSHFTLRAPHFISSHLSSSHLISPYLSSSHLLPSLLKCHLSKFFSTVFISSEHCWTSLISQKLILSHLSSLYVRKFYCHRKFFYTKTAARRTLLHRDFFRHRCVYTEKCSHTQRIHTEKNEKQIYTREPFTQRLFYRHFFSQRHFLHRVPCTHRRAPECTKHFPAPLCTTSLAQRTYQHILLCTTKLAQGTSQYYLVLLSTTKLAQSTPQYYFVLRRLRNVRPMQYYFVLQSLHAVLRTTLYDKTCAKYFPVILRSARHAQSHKVLPSTTSY